jgi:hypothetical protein
MAVHNSRAERAPLIHRSTSVRAIYQKDDDTESGISTTRGSFIISSIGLLIFLQGMSRPCCYCPPSYTCLLFLLGSMTQLHCQNFAKANTHSVQHFHTHHNPIFDSRGPRRLRESNMAHFIVPDRHVFPCAPHGPALPGLQPSSLHVLLHHYDLRRNGHYWILKFI